MSQGGPEGGFSTHLERVVWKPITWDPESPEQLSGGVPVPRPESWLVPLRGTLEDFRAGRTGAWYFRAWPYGPKIELFRIAAGEDRTMEPIAEFAADQIPAIVDALLYVHRRTREHDYDGPDAGLPPVRDHEGDGGPDATA
ncbi:MAG TPA: hypothetical protein VFQ38_11745 [Longimicrobiales bacterium]|nr:hypothetical protein [Longimicrobiales bacterium]